MLRETRLIWVQRLLLAADAPIAIDYAPYNRSGVWICRHCHKPFLRYTEYGGYYSDERIRAVAPKAVLPSWGRALAEFGITPVGLYGYEKLRNGSTPVLRKNGKDLPPPAEWPSLRAATHEY